MLKSNPRTSEVVGETFSARTRLQKVSTAMRARIPSPTHRRRASSTRRGHRAPHTVPAAPEDRSPEARSREAGGPIDHAHYSCVCGYAFEAAVSTSVSCPHCGAGQAW